MKWTGTRGNENVRRQQPQTKHCEASEGQSANGGEGGSKTCGRHVDGSGADNLTIAAVCAVGRGLDAPLLLVIVPVYFFSEGNLLFFFIQACLGRRRLA